MLLILFLAILVIGIGLLNTDFEELGFVFFFFGVALSLPCVIVWAICFFSADRIYKEDVARYESIVTTLDQDSSSENTIKDMNPVDFAAVTTAYDEMTEWNAYVLDMQKARDSIWVGFIVPKYFDNLPLIDESKYADFAYEINNIQTK